MAISAIIAALVLVVFASAQAPDERTPAGPVGLVFPVRRGPLSLVEVEEFTRKLPDGTSSTETRKSKIQRDALGRLRIEWVGAGPSGESLHVIQIVDPAAGSMALLDDRTKIATRVITPKSFFGPGLPGVGEALPAGNWKATTENLGKRMIEGVEFEGTRTTETSDDHPALIAVEERWYSKDLGLIGMAEASRTNRKHSARIQELQRREPDPSLFAIPSDYTVRDFDIGAHR